MKAKDNLELNLARHVKRNKKRILQVQNQKRKIQNLGLVVLIGKTSLE